MKWHGQWLFKNVYFFNKHFYYITGLDFAIKNSILANLQFFFADSKSKAQELSNDVSFVIFGHQTWDLEGGGITEEIKLFVFLSEKRSGLGPGRSLSRSYFFIYLFVISLF